jgi:hypothetical protein
MDNPIRNSFQEKIEDLRDKKGINLSKDLLSKFQDDSESKRNLEDLHIPF